MALPPKYWSGGAQEGQEVQPTWDQFLSNEQWFFVQNPATAMADVKMWQQYAPPEVFNKYFNDAALAERRQAFLDYHPSEDFFDKVANAVEPLVKVGVPIFLGTLTAGAAGFGPLAVTEGAAAGAVATETIAPVVTQSAETGTVVAAETGGAAAALDPSSQFFEFAGGGIPPAEAAATSIGVTDVLSGVKNAVSIALGLKRIQATNALADSMQQTPNLPMETQFGTSPLSYGRGPLESAGASSTSSIWLIAGLFFVVLFIFLRR